jgi:uroporphyrinogen decarboxylase
MIKTNAGWQDLIPLSETAMRKESMTPRERWLAVLNRQKPDRVPMDYWATPEATEKTMAHLNCHSEREMLEKLHVDFVVEVKPVYVGPPVPAQHDEFGCKYQNISYGTGEYEECISYPLARFTSVEEIKMSYTWPDPDWWDYSGIKKQLKGNERSPILGGNYEPFLIYKKLRGEEQAYMDMALNPEIVHYSLDRLLHLGYENTRRILEQIPDKALLSYVAEDMGAQDDLLFSPAHIHEFLIPRMKKVIELIHQAGAFVFHHNDGSIRRIIPDMIEAGIDILNPIQWRCENMNRAELKNEFGDSVVFHGGMDNQQTLPFGTVDDVKEEVLENLRILGNKGGYILAPCHNIQAVSSPENIVTMYETGYENGWT